MTNQNLFSIQLENFQVIFVPLLDFQIFNHLLLTNLIEHVELIIDH
jgi:hypothetical protein